jgi:hypothetical protein
VAVADPPTESDDAKVTEKTPLKDANASPAPSVIPNGRSDSAATLPSLVVDAFTPSRPWFEYWHGQLPLTSITSLLETLLPQIEKLCMENNWNDEAGALFPHI